MAPILSPLRHVATSLFFTLISLCVFASYGWTAQLSLSWDDNATNETGFKIERKDGTGSYAPYIDVGANVKTYTDTKVTSGVRYCYRVSAYNANTTSPYSNDACVDVPQPQSPLLSVSLVGQGTVSSGSTGISCLPTCSKTLPTGTQVSLTPTPNTGWQFSSWGGSCSGKTIPCVVTMDQAKNVTATFTQQPTGGGGGSGQPVPPTPLMLGTFHDGNWFYDKNRNARWDGCATDTCFVFGLPGDQPVVGVWIPGTAKRIGVFRRGAWYFDRNGNQGWDGCSGGDACLSFGGSGDQAIVGDWNGDGKTDIGVFRDGRWFLDDNGNGRFDRCGTIVGRDDKCPLFGAVGDRPVAGDWNGDGKTDIGIYRNGAWQLDKNGNGFFDGCVVDLCVSWGSSWSHPIVGDWNGTRQTRIGSYHRGAWQLDTNSSFKFEGCSADKCFGFGSATHMPVPR